MIDKIWIFWGKMISYIEKQIADESEIYKCFSK